MANNLIAPNGKPSNLSAEQYALVRTPEFKAWFGDWENDPQNASKVVDENGEPMVVYHGTYAKFNIFESKVNIHFFSQIKSDAKTFVYSHVVKPKDNDGIIIYDCFLNLRKILNPKKLTEIEKNKIEILVDSVDNKDKLYALGDLEYLADDLEVKDLSDYEFILFLLSSLESYNVLEQPVFIDWMKKEGYDGFMVEEYNFKKQNYAVFKPSNIKLADGSNTTFDAANPDIRYADGGELFSEKDGLYVIIKDVKEENKYKGAYKKIFDIIEEGVSFYNAYGADYEEIIDGNLHVHITPRPELNAIEKIKRLAKVEVVEKNYADGGEISWEDYQKTQFDEEINRDLPSDYFEPFEIKEVNILDYPILLKNINGLEFRKWRFGGIGVFDGNKRVAFADNGAIEVAKDYQKRGIGLELVTLLKELNPNHKFGNMTPQGRNLMRTYYDKKIANKMEQGGETGKDITCINCGWHWNTSDSDESDKYVCHKCGFDNKAFYDPEPIGVMADGGAVSFNDANYGHPKVSMSDIPFIHETSKEISKKILNNGFIVGTNQNITKGVYTIPIVYKKEPFNTNHVELSIFLKPNSKIFWTNSKRPMDFYYGIGNKFFENLFLKLGGKKDDYNRVEFLRNFEKWLLENKYCGVQQGGEIVITDLSCIDTIELFDRDVRYADGGKVDFGEVLFGEDKAVSALQPKGLTRIEPNTEDENKLQKALYDYTQSSLNKDSIIKNKSLLESAANQFPQLLRPKISPFDNNFLFRGVSFSEDNKDNIIKMLGISIEKPFGDDVIQFSNEDSSDKNAGSSVVYGKYFQNADFGIKDFEFTSWTTDYKIAKRFNRSTGFIYAVSFENSDDLYLRPKLSNAVSSYRENEMLFYNEGKGISTKRVDKDSILVRYIYILYSADNLARLLDTDIYTVRANINARPILEGSTSESALQHDLNILNKDKLQEDWFKKGGLSRTPAPKKDRVFGSDKNKVGSAASKESAKKINLSEDIITTLSNKAKEYNEENSGNKVTLNTLKAVMRRGMGAYSTSHRPTITGGAPNSRQAWGFARVNKFLKKKSGEKVKAAYVQDDDLLEMGGTINKNNLKMIQQHYHSMKPIEDIQVGDIYVIKEDMFAPHQDHEHPQHLSTRYATVEVKSPCHRNLDSYTLEVMECDCDNAAGRYAKGKVIERSRKHILSSGKLKSAVAKATEFKDGGELNADSQEVKEYFAHDSGNAGGLLVGKRHSEGGIKADVKSTGQQIEMEGGEAVITRGAVNSKKKYVYEGKEMTTREILSDLNVKGGGVAFADGGDVPEKMNCGCSSMKVGGISYTPQDFITLSEKEYQEHRLIDGIEKERKDHFYTLAKLNSGAISIEQALREIASKEMMIDPKYPYSE